MSIDSSGTTIPSIQSASGQAEVVPTTNAKGDFDQAKVKEVACRDLRSQALSTPGVMENIATYLDPTSHRDELGELVTAVRIHSIMTDRASGRETKWSEAGITDEHLRHVDLANLGLLNDKLRFGHKAKELRRDLEEAVELSKKEGIHLISASYKTAPYLCEVLLHLDPSGNNSYLISLLETFTIKEWTDSFLPRELPEALVYGSDNLKIEAALNEFVEHAYVDRECLKAIAVAYDKHKKPAALAALAKLGSSDSIRDRARAVQALAGSKSEEALEVLETIKKSTYDNFTRDEAMIIGEELARAYTQINTPEAFEALKELYRKGLISDHSKPYAYSHFALKEAFDFLETLKNSDCDMTRRAVVEVCRKYKSPESFIVLQELRLDRAAHVRTEVAKVLGEYGTKDAYRALSAIPFADLHVSDKFNMIQAYSQFDTEEALATLLDFATVDPLLSEQVIIACGSFTIPAAKIALDTFSKNTEDPKIRAAAATGCANLKDREAALKILDRLQDNDLNTPVLRAVAEACESFTDDESVEKAIQILESLDKNPLVLFKDGIGQSCGKLQRKEAFDLLWTLRKERPEFDSYQITDAIRSYLV